MENLNQKIRERIKKKDFELETIRKEYNKLNQIDLLSSTGNEINNKINRIRGEIKSLEWVQRIISKSPNPSNRR